MRIQRSQSKLSLSASFEALAVYFPCMNSFDEEDGGKMTAEEMSQQQLAEGMDFGLVGGEGLLIAENWCSLKRAKNVDVRRACLMLHDICACISLVCNNCQLSNVLLEFLLPPVAHGVNMDAYWLPACLHSAHAGLTISHFPFLILKRHSVDDNWDFSEFSQWIESLCLFNIVVRLPLHVSSAVVMTPTLCVYIYAS